MSVVSRQIRAAVLVSDATGPTDARLLESFLATHDEAAFESLVRRHGPMVMGVCTRVLRHPQDAEDAFQATFLVLVRKAASVSPPGMVGNWLYGVAHQTALKARAMAARRGAKERQVVGTPEPAVADTDDALWRELRPIIDEELSRLPDKYRAPLVLCDIEERSYKEAAEQLGWPEGTVAGRLSRARAMLADRLTRRGVVLPLTALVGVLAGNAASSAVPPATVVSTVKAASLLAAGHATTGAVSATVVTLTEGVVRAMLISKLKVASAVLLAACLAVAGASFAFSTAPVDGQDQKKPAQPPAQPQPNDKKPDDKKADPKANPKKGDKGNNEKDGQNNQNGNDEKNGQNNQNGNDEKNGNSNQNGNDEKNGQNNQNGVNEKNGNNNQNGNDEQGTVKAVDPNANTITVVVQQQGKPVEKVFTLPKAVPVTLGGKPAKLGDVKPGMKVGVALDKDKKGVVGIKQVNEPNGQNNDGNNGQKNQKND
ncbi:MAG: RNA polymerase sigma factor [Gemmataceae bacterium]